MNGGIQGTTLDSFYRGALTLHQPESGYRFSIDAVLLAAHARPRPEDLVLDLGTGCGVVALLMARRCETLTIYGVELQADLAQLARHNVLINDLDDRVHIIQGDIKKLDGKLLPRPADLIVANPPYYRLTSGRLNPDDQRAVARHELRLTLDQFLAATKRHLRTAGRMVCVYPCTRLIDLLTGMRKEGIEPKRIRLVHGKADDEARFAIVEGIHQGRPGLTVDAALVMYSADGNYAPAMEPYFSI
ncbi:MAG: tRNA1(Val) (adenine(37)-N6)-methyltransferase [Desulfosarcinaceae bacterium]|nr:tRNA1(Val) (adenine(37)-N6)-methyltransferase [Desulfosarcinaceae bacterium]